MSTNSLIALEYPNGGHVEEIYCHWDGYMEHNGVILYAAYNTFEKVKELVDHGDASVIRRNIGKKHNLDDMGDTQARDFNWCQFYGRDRNESNCEARVYENFEDYKKTCRTESYNYLFRADENCWYVRQYEDNQYRKMKFSAKFLKQHRSLIAD